MAILKKQILAGVAILLLSTSTTISARTDEKLISDEKKFPSLLKNSAESAVLKSISDSIYTQIGLQMYGLEREVFYAGYKGFQYLQSKGMLRKNNIITICDYSQSSSNKRLYVIDVAEGRLLYNTYVSHGRNSGEEFATSFSNLKESNKSSLGFMITAETYNGKAGYSMRFDGAEPGINDRVRQRDIVLHGSNFVNEKRVEMRGAIGKSLGCPAVPSGEHKLIIDVIKGGSCFFINHPDDWYTHSSTILNSRFDVIPLQLNNFITQPGAILPEATPQEITTTVINSTVANGQ